MRHPRIPTELADRLDEIADRVHADGGCDPTSFDHQETAELLGRSVNHIRGRRRRAEQLARAQLHATLAIARHLDVTRLALEDVREALEDIQESIADATKQAAG